jgi:BNR repeat-like domain
MFPVGPDLLVHPSFHYSPRPSAPPSRPSSNTSSCIKKPAATAAGPPTTASGTGETKSCAAFDRGKSWQGPFDFPLLGQTGIAARTDYIVNGKHNAFVFLTAAKSNGKEGCPFCARTTDGGLHWNLVSWIADEPPGFAIMPSTVRLSPDRLISAMRIHDRDKDSIDLFESHDNAAKWQYLARPVASTGGHGGNPPSMIRLKDGRICLTYGYRAEPYEIRAILSSDEGKTWSSDIVLDKGATWEVGYTRTVQRPDGKIVTFYYASQVISATIWDPSL